ncbi:MAG: inositol monophosphatase [Campylobacteraceae bacterium]|mgnify:CR=1 FL=1|nr:inositol monophosphatase [Campylobacteraceae bacterium]
MSEIINENLNPKELRKIAEEAVLCVGDYLREVFRSNVEFEQKRDQHDLVTLHDKECERRIIALIKKYNPSGLIIGEESGTLEGDSKITWYIDPIDGTSNFVQGLAFFCAVVGVAVDDKMVAGAVYDPMADNLFSADDEKAYLNGEILKTKDALPPKVATLITGYPTALDIETDGKELALEIFHEFAMEFSSVRRTGSGALSLCHVAAGWTDSAFGSYVSPWDISAPMQIVRMAGGTYLPFDYDDKDINDQYTAGYIAFGPKGNYPVLEVVAEKIIKSRGGKGRIFKN